MSRYIGPRNKISRRLNKYIYGNKKYFKKKQYPPGQHGLLKKRIVKKSNYYIQLLEKQKVKYKYGILEKQFKRMFNIVNKKKGITGELLLQMCERRLDNVVYRIGYAVSRYAARQLVTHKHIKVNNKTINIPSFNIKIGDIISLNEKMKNNINVLNALTINKNKNKDWLKWNEENMSSECLKLPNIKNIDIDHQLIVELYNK
ncbi:30S ribosomal protein S4 [Candidatus Shikimatogenerans bostrichidophilus]|uniref:30S ribosomal protein S4 n=1 Tax=Candidatus Shikimatogenerans bostrichidophilus TaxID=2943807 RepID=UPI002966AB57